jgi:hypothetical protein
MTEFLEFFYRKLNEEEKKKEWLWMYIMYIMRIFIRVVNEEWLRNRGEHIWSIDYSLPYY